MFNNVHEVQGHSQLIITKVSSINLVSIHVTSRCCLSLIQAYRQWPSTYSALQTPPKAVDADWLVAACHVLIPSIVANQIIIHCEIRYSKKSDGISIIYWNNNLIKPFFFVANCFDIIVVLFWCVPLSQERLAANHHNKRLRSCYLTTAMLGLECLQQRPADVFKTDCECYRAYSPF